MIAVQQAILAAAASVDVWGPFAAMAIAGALILGLYLAASPR